MELTPEERQRIYEEERAKRAHSQSSNLPPGFVPVNHTSTQKTSGVKLGIFIALAVTIGGIWYCNSSLSSNQNSTADYANTTSQPVPPLQKSEASTNFSSTNTSKRSAPIDKSLTYERINKNSNAYIGQRWEFGGRIIQIQEQGGSTFALVSIDGWGSKNVRVEADFTTEFVEKNQVHVVGTITGAYSYTSVAGWNITIPGVKADEITKPGGNRKRR